VVNPRRPERTALAVLAGYNLVQNLVVPDRAYVPANLAVTGGLVAMARRAGASWDDLGLDPARLPAGLRLGGAVALTTAGILTLAAGTQRGRPALLDQRARGHAPRKAAFRSLLRFPIGTALFEEVAFRGVLSGLWRRRTSPGRAAAVTAAAFGAWHLLPTFRVLPGSPARADTAARRLAGAAAGAGLTALASLGFGWMRDRTGSVAAPWLAHAAFNSCSYLAARRAWRVTP
jgi:membrane protease YdiL (CAAX protease family)